MVANAGVMIIVPTMPIGCVTLSMSENPIPSTITQNRIVFTT
jgi:hypothetical protein